ncbi:MAG TPA: ACT domain-containing protein [Desulfurococcales archaeon]|nr:ACT domain-containing protein [Desulfurococcales archaeon]
MPLELNTLVHCNGRRIFGLNLRVKNRPGVLERIIRIISDRGLNIVAVLTSAPSPTAEEGLIFICVDFTGRESTKPHVVKEISSLDVVYDVKLVEPTIAGILYDESFFPIYLAGKRAIILDYSSIIGFIQGLKGRFSEDIAAVILYHAGYRVGQEIYKEYIRKSKIRDMPIPIANEILKPLLIAYGWCKIEVHGVFKDGIALKAYNLWECEIQKPYYIEKGIKAKTSHYVRGFLAGVYENVFKGRTIVDEVKCLNMGDDYCLFQIKKT